MKPGQSIPAGLHVRMNIETGLKEARLLEDPALSHENFVKRLRDHDKLRQEKMKTLHEQHHGNRNHNNGKLQQHGNHGNGHGKHAVMAVVQEKRELFLAAKTEHKLDHHEKVEEIVADAAVVVGGQGNHGGVGIKGVRGAGGVGGKNNILVAAVVLCVVVSLAGVVYRKRKLGLVKSLSTPADKIL